MAGRAAPEGPGPMGGGVELTGDGDSRFAQAMTAAKLQAAADSFQEGLEAGMDEDELVAALLGKMDARGMSEKDQEYADRIKAKLKEVALDVSDASRQGQAYLSAAERAYERGQYRNSLELLEDALRYVNDKTLLGGKVLIQKALSLDAAQRREESIELYKFLEQNHTAPFIRKQAENLRYIAEAPKIELTEEERVKIPDMGGLDKMDKSKRRAGGFGSKPKPRPKKAAKEKSWEDKFTENYRPPLGALR